MPQEEFDQGEELLYGGAQCARCDLDLDPRTGLCPNERCPFHGRYQDEIVKWTPPGEEEEVHIRSVRAISTDE